MMMSDIDDDGVLLIQSRTHLTLSRMAQKWWQTIFTPVHTCSRPVGVAVAHKCSVRPKVSRD